MPKISNRKREIQDVESLLTLMWYDDQEDTEDFEDLILYQEQLMNNRYYNPRMAVPKSSSTYSNNDQDATNYNDNEISEYEDSDSSSDQYTEDIVSTKRSRTDESNAYLNRDTPVYKINNRISNKITTPTNTTRSISPVLRDLFTQSLSNIKPKILSNRLPTGKINKQFSVIKTIENERVQKRFELEFERNEQRYQKDLELRERQLNIDKEKMIEESKRAITMQLLGQGHSIPEIKNVIKELYPDPVASI